MKPRDILPFFGFIGIFLVMPLQAQTDTTHVRADSVELHITQEMILDEIYIEAVIEKPNVAILPTRAEIDFGELDFIERSFEFELKRGPSRRMYFNKEFEAVRRLNKLREILNKEEARLKQVDTSDGK